MNKNYVCGCDAGSTYGKAAIMDLADPQIMGALGAAEIARRKVLAQRSAG